MVDAELASDQAFERRIEPLGTFGTMWLRPCAEQRTRTRREDREGSRAQHRRIRRTRTHEGGADERQDQEDDELRLRDGEEIVAG